MCIGWRCDVFGAHAEQRWESEKYYVVPSTIHPVPDTDAIDNNPNEENKNRFQLRKHLHKYIFLFDECACVGSGPELHSMQTFLDSDFDAPIAIRAIDTV